MVSFSKSWHLDDSSGGDKKKVLLEMMVTFLFLGISLEHSLFDGTQSGDEFYLNLKLTNSIFIVPPLKLAIYGLSLHLK